MIQVNSVLSIRLLIKFHNYDSINYITNFQEFQLTFIHNSQSLLSHGNWTRNYMNFSTIMHMHTQQFTRLLHAQTRFSYVPLQKNWIYYLLCFVNKVRWNYKSNKETMKWLKLLRSYQISGWTNVVTSSSQCTLPLATHGLHSNLNNEQNQVIITITIFQMKAIDVEWLMKVTRSFSN